MLRRIKGQKEKRMIQTNSKGKAKMDEATFCRPFFPVISIVSREHKDAKDAIEIIS